ncbi:MAG: Major facilitator transporter [Ramlibacter sp.]|nr:Major facilitator transporter [Ramlibacter sp.]
MTEDHSRRVTLTVAASFFMLLLDGTILNTSLPPMAVALNVPPLTLSAAVTVYLLAGAAVLPLASWLGDRHGMRRLFVVAIAVFTLASLLCGLAQNAPQLVLARALQGVGGGLMMPIGRTLVLQRARKEDFIRIAALLTWPALFAPVLGPPLGGLITTYGSWRWNFLLNVPLGAVAILLILRWVPVDTPGERRPLDRSGAIGAALGLMLMLGGLEWIAHVIGDGAAALPALLTTGGGIALLAWTVRHLRRVPHPVVSLAPLAQRTFAVATASAGTFAAMCLHACPFLLPLLFQLALGRNAVSSGALLLPYFLGNLGMKSVTTPILVRFGFRNVMVTAGTCSAAAIAAFGFLSAQTPWAALVALLFFAGCARSMLLTALTSLTFADIPLAQRGAASTLSTVSTQVAATLGVAVGAILLALAQFVHGHAHLAAPDFRIAFVTMGLIHALTVLRFWSLPPSAGADMIGRPAPRAGG